MAPPRKEPAPTEGDSASDQELNFDFHYKPSASIPQAMESIDKLKLQRSEIQKNIGKDYADKLASIQERIEEYYRGETEKISDHNEQQHKRLEEALKKLVAFEEQISRRIDSLRDDAAHIAMLVNAIYIGRKEAAIESARTSKPDILKKQGGSDAYLEEGYEGCSN